MPPLNVAIARITRDFKDISTDPSIKAVRDPKDAYKLYVDVVAPEGTPYSGCNIHIVFTYPKNFPAAPPACVTSPPIYHPNIKLETGKVCLNILKAEEWDPSLTTMAIVQSILVLLGEPNTEHFVNAEAADLCQKDPAKFAAKVKECMAAAK